MTLELSSKASSFLAARLRSSKSNIVFLIRIDLGVTSTSSSLGGAGVICPASVWSGFRSYPYF